MRPQEPVGGIPFTQYVSPNGIARTTWIARDPSIERTALRVLDAGGDFSAEVLVDGSVALYCEWRDVEITRLVPNGPQVPLAVDSLVAEAWRRILEASEVKPRPKPKRKRRGSHRGRGRSS